MGNPGKIKEAEFEALTKQFNDITKDIEESLAKVSTEMKQIDGKNDIWKGKTAVAVTDKYKSYESNFENINSKLSDFGSYLNKTLDNYRRAMQKSEATLETTDENYKVS